MLLLVVARTPFLAEPCVCLELELEHWEFIHIHSLDKRNHSVSERPRRYWTLSLTEPPLGAHVGTGLNNENHTTRLSGDLRNG